MPDLIIRGLPSSLANDATWFSSTPDQPTEPIPLRKGSRIFGPLSVVAVIFLIILADYLFWQQPIGVSLVIFSAGLCAAALMHLRPSFTKQNWLLFAGLWSVSALPVLEFMQTISVLILVLGHSCLLIWSTQRSTKGDLARTLLFLPHTFLHFAIKTTAHTGLHLVQDKPQMTRSAMAAWVLPLMVGSVFLLLFIGANPVFQEWANDLLNLNISQDAFARATFWCVTGILVLPFAIFRKYASELLSQAACRRSTVRRKGALINARSVQNSLVLFNAMFLLQNVTDFVVLWGASGLPQGMTYARYAHSGAYPLMATSILAILFALISRRFTYGSSFIKMLLLIWVAQNVILLGSAIFRLDLYMSVYGLTYLRLRASVGMVLVLAAMLLMIWQLWRSKSNEWLAGACTIVAAGVFYACSFVNFGYVIAAENLSRFGHPRDIVYLCKSAPSGVAAVSDHYAATGQKRCIKNLRKTKFRADNWRGWSYRAARMETSRRTYLEVIAHETRRSRDRLTTKPYQSNERRPAE